MYQVLLIRSHACMDLTTTSRMHGVRFSHAVNISDICVSEKFEILKRNIWIKQQRRESGFGVD